MSSTTDPHEFYQLLYNSTEFTSELGKMTLAVGRLEAKLKALLIRAGIRTNLKKDTLGLLAAKLANYHGIKPDELSLLNEIRTQRNYLTHNLYALMSSQIDEGSITGIDLLPRDVAAYIKKAKALVEHIHEFIDILDGKLQELP